MRGKAGYEAIIYTETNKMIAIALSCINVDGFLRQTKLFQHNIIMVNVVSVFLQIPALMGDTPLTL